VRHGHVTINGKRVTIPSYRARPGEVVALKNVTRENFNVKRNLDILDRSVPGWLEVAENGFAVTVRVVPQREQIDESIKEQLIVELYSK
jgi:small subunit ribosomal protein S4